MNAGAFLRLAAALLSLAIWAQTACAQGPTPYPTQVKDLPGRGWAQIFPWMGQNRQSFYKQRPLKQGAVVFVGDSLTAGWADLDSAFPGMLVANRGIGGDTSRGLLFRFGEDVLALNPRAVVLLIGTNDLSAGQEPADTMFNIGRMLDMIQAQATDIPVVVCTLPPRDDPKARIDNKKLLTLNASLMKLPDERHQSSLSVLDLHALLTDGQGAPVAEYLKTDRLHLMPAAYVRWREAMTVRLSGLGLR